MTSSIDALFEEKAQTATAPFRGLPMTQEVTNHSEKLLADVFNHLATLDEMTAKKSMEDNDTLDSIIIKAIDFEKQDLSYLEGVSEDEADRMIKSQQSKRSRLKGKKMTKDNYSSLVTAAVSELIIRLASGKNKTAGGAKSSKIGYTDEEIENFKTDQAGLRKAIRNLQSKKCIMRSKANFDENSDDFQEILLVEEQLKGLRTGGGTSPRATDVRVTTIQEMLEGVDISQLKAMDAKELIKKINEAVAEKQEQQKEVDSE